MNLDVLGLQLHQRFAINEPLSPEEQVLLDTWYAEQEFRRLGAGGGVQVGCCLYFHSMAVVTLNPFNTN
jgi:hypothetical protein